MDIQIELMDFNETHITITYPTMSGVQADTLYIHDLDDHRDRADGVGASASGAGGYGLEGAIQAEDAPAAWCVDTVGRGHGVESRRDIWT